MVLGVKESIKTTQVNCHPVIIYNLKSHNHGVQNDRQTGNLALKCIPISNKMET